MTSSHADSSHTALHPATQVVSLGRPAREAGAALNPPISLSSTFIGSGTTPPGGPVYGRTDNETWLALEGAIGTLEGASDGCVAFSSGMAAVAAVLDLIPQGGLLIAPPTGYNTTLELAQVWQASGRLRLATVDLTDAEALQAALEPGAMVWIETPSNPMLDVVDIEAVVAAARQVGAMTVADNTFATPLRQQPLAQGVDLVVHSVTKYLAGHSDLLLGAVVTKDPERHQEVFTARRLTGAIPGPFEAWLALRGMRTLAVRLDRSETTARLLAERLAAHPAVTTVRYPGFGGMLSIEVGDAAAADQVVDRLQVWTAATSLGGVESLAERRRRHGNEPLLVSEGLIRLSVGIEDAEDLWQDLNQALRG